METTLRKIGFALRQVNNGRYNIKTYIVRGGQEDGNLKVDEALNSSHIFTQEEWDMLSREVPQICNRIAWLERNVILGGGGTKKSTPPQSDGNSELDNWVKNGAFDDIDKLNFYSAVERAGYPGDLDIVYNV